MTTLNDFNRIDDGDDVVATDINELIANALRAEFSNTETISATKELADVDTRLQILTPRGANRDVELPPEAVSNHAFTIINPSASSYSLIVKDDSGTITYAVLAPGVNAEFISDGTTWRVLGNVNGPASSTDNALARFDGATGHLIQNSVATLDDSGNLTLPATALVSTGNYYGFSVTIADDEAYSFIPASPRGFLYVTGGATDNTIYAVLYYNTTTPVVTQLHIGANIETTTGALTGTTGTDTKMTISARATGGKIYVENRRGGNRTVTLTMVG